jgi:hypothetical protein
VAAGVLVLVIVLALVYIGGEVLHVPGLSVVSRFLRSLLF